MPLAPRNSPKMHTPSVVLGPNDGISVFSSRESERPIDSRNQMASPFGGCRSHFLVFGSADRGRRRHRYRQREVMHKARRIQHAFIIASDTALHQSKQEPCDIPKMLATTRCRANLDAVDELY